MVIWKFYGTSDLGPMWWTVQLAEDGHYDVMESYDEGRTWITNCVVGDEQAGWDFISAWFSGFYGR